MELVQYEEHLVHIATCHYSTSLKVDATPSHGRLTYLFMLFLLLTVKGCGGYDSVFKTAAVAEKAQVTG